MPRVVLDARDAFAAQPRGWNRYVLELLRALETRAPQAGIELVALRRGGPGPELAFEQLQLPWILRREGADAVHAPNCFLPLVRPCPGVVTVNDLAFEDHPEDFARLTGWKYRTFTRRAVRSAQQVICPSQTVRSELCERYGADPETTWAIHDAPSLAAGDGEPPPGPYLLAVGDLRRKKNLRRLVEAFAGLRKRGFPHRLVLAGLDSGEGAHLAGEGVELTGWVSEERLDALMRGADLLVHPSLQEGFGLVLLEAMVRGTPVAAARAGALPETGGDAAVYFDPEDQSDIEKTLASLLDDPGRLAELAARGREHAEGFSWERAADETLGVYRAALG